MSTGIGSEVFMGLFGGEKGRENFYYLDKMLPVTLVNRQDHPLHRHWANPFWRNYNSCDDMLLLLNEVLSQEEG